MVVIDEKFLLDGIDALAVEGHDDVA